MPAMVCNYPTFLRDDDSVNAFADGSRIIVTSGLMRFAEADDELAFVIGHELAHNTMGHIESKTGNMILGGIVGAILTGLSGVNVIDPMMQVGVLAFSQAFEAEADYVGVYYAAIGRLRHEESRLFLAPDGGGASPRDRPRRHDPSVERQALPCRGSGDQGNRRETGTRRTPHSLHEIQQEAGLETGGVGPDPIAVRRGSGNYPAMVSPPETLIVWPVMKSASLLARKATIPG